MEESTDSIRALAPNWSLAGDDKLLGLLQSTHQRIVSKCREVNTKLNEMVSALDDASINLQNVNNKFMALSSSQFIESRVYDDDADVTPEAPVQEPPEEEPVDELTLLKRSVATLDGMHETAEIYDESDSDDSDAEISVVLKAKDPYALRPLPHIIGSQPWKTKWHAGLLIEESDSDSCASRAPAEDPDQYSSEDELQSAHLPDNTISETSGSLRSSGGGGGGAAPACEHAPPPAPPPAPADVAAELARRLGQAPPRVAEEPETAPPPPATRTVYRPQQPVSSTIFSDEPPPMDRSEPYESDSQEEHDIFAEINRNKPYDTMNRSQSTADDLFGVPYRNDVVDHRVETRKGAKPKTTLFDDEPEPETFVGRQSVPKDNAVNRTEGFGDNHENTTKKPVGGISLFGSSKGAESIGAAILNRTRRKSSSSERNSDEDVPKAKTTIKNKPAVIKDRNNEPAVISDSKTSNEKDIFDNLFAKSDNKKQTTKPVKEVKTKPKDVKDLFSDNIFDDIDDIFTSTIKIPTKEANKNAKSIFDDDNEDLFSDIAKEDKPNSSKDKKSIFDSDDDLFSDLKVSANYATARTDKPSDIDKTNNVIFVESQNNKQGLNPITKEINIKTEMLKSEMAKEPIIFNAPAKPVIESKPKATSKSIFDSDSDDDLFSDIKQNTKPIVKKDNGDRQQESKQETGLFAENKQNKVSTDKIKVNEKPIPFQSPSLFEEEEIDELFINANKLNIPSTDTLKHSEQNFAKVENFKADKDDTDNNRTSELIFEQQQTVESKPHVSITNSLTKSDMMLPKTEEKDYPKDELIGANSEHNIKELSRKRASVEDNLYKLIEEPNSNTSDAHDSVLAENNESQLKVTDENRKSSLNQPPTCNLNDHIFEEISVKDKVNVIAEQEKSVSLPAGIFDDIMTEPPVFEKTKEIKKTTNVNALFEDDSDDETLFFKKNDIISDEKPEIFSPSANFGIFNDEPPALDIDFAPKSNNFDDDDLFSSLPKSNTTNIQKNLEPAVIESATTSTNDNITQSQPTAIPFSPVLQSNLFSSPELPKSTQPVAKAQSKEIPDSDEELFSNVSKTGNDVPELSKEHKITKRKSYTETSIDQVDEVKSQEIKKDVDLKKIGKLNTKNYNINVQALVPGASPKKVIPKERNDSSNDDKPIKSSEETQKYNTEMNNAEEITKSTSFASKPDPGILDNNLSKQRAKIQVKRRPSTRRARHEAVRKSVIDINDETDNSSSIDEPKPRNDDAEPTEYENKAIKVESRSEQYISKDRIIENNKISEPKSKQTLDDIQNPDHMSVFLEIDFTKNTETDIRNKPASQKNEPNEDVTSRDFTESQSDLLISPQSTTKVVYILNDEDIFAKTEKPELQTDDELFKTAKETDNLFENTSKNDLVETSKERGQVFKTADEDASHIGNIYKQTSSKIKVEAKDIHTNKETGNLFKSTTAKDDLSKKRDEVLTDEDVCSSKNIRATENAYKQTDANTKDATKSTLTKKETKSLFDLSDDDDELFGKSVKTKKVETKSKLFDSDSEEDIFSGKKKEVKRVKEVRAVVKGSLFGDEEDDDLFGAATKPVTEPSRSVPPSKLAAATSTEPVFDDPLSMLDED